MIIMWNWKKINSMCDLPEFGKEVMLFEEGINTALKGWLKSVDIQGNHWKLGERSHYNAFQDFINAKSCFEPTHWCEIETPEKETLKNN